jgi:hypothetical protein
MNVLPLFLVPRASRTVRVQRMQRGMLISPPVFVPSRPADVRACFFGKQSAFFVALTELRIYGTSRALSRIGAIYNPRCFPPWTLTLAIPGTDGSLLVPCYEARP